MHLEFWETSLFFFYYLLLYYNEGTLKTIDLILTCVFTVNSLIILSKGMLQITGTFEWNQFFSDVGCKVILYILRPGRSMSISTTCLLSVFQAISISPRNSCWKDLMVRTPRFMGFSISLSWIPHILTDMFFPVYLSTKKSSKNILQKKKFWILFLFSRMWTIVGSLYMIFWVLPKVLFSVLLVSSSNFMIVILFGHKKWIQYIHSSHFFPRTSTESRATQNILILVCIFLLFYSLSSILQGCIVLSHNLSWWPMNITIIISMCFLTLGPFSMTHNNTVFEFYFS